MIRGIKLAFSIFLLFSFSLSIAQQDTVYIEEEPIYVKENIIVKEVKRSSYYLSGFVGGFYNANYYNPCKECITFTNSYKSSTTSLPGYSGGLTISYSKKNLLYSVGLGVTHLKEKIDYKTSDTTILKSINKISSWDGSLGVGYWYHRDKKTSFILTSTIYWSRMNIRKGSIPDFRNEGTLISLSDSPKLRSNQFNGEISVKILFFSDKRLKLLVEPYYNVSLKNINKRGYPFLELYNKFGLKTGFFISI